MLVQIHKTGGFDNENDFILYKLYIWISNKNLGKIVATAPILCYTNCEMWSKFAFLHYLTIGYPKNEIFMNSDF